MLIIKELCIFWDWLNNKDKIQDQYAENTQI